MIQFILSAKELIAVLSDGAPTGSAGSAGTEIGIPPSVVTDFGPSIEMIATLS